MGAAFAGKKVRVFTVCWPSKLGQSKIPPSQRQPTLIIAATGRADGASCSTLIGAQLGPNQVRLNRDDASGACRARARKLLHVNAEPKRGELIIIIRPRRRADHVPEAAVPEHQSNKAHWSGLGSLGSARCCSGSSSSSSCSLSLSSREPHTCEGTYFLTRIPILWLGNESLRERARARLNQSAAPGRSVVRQQ